MHIDATTLITAFLQWLVLEKFLIQLQQLYSQKNSCSHVKVMCIFVLIVNFCTRKNLKLCINDKIWINGVELIYWILYSCVFHNIYNSLNKCLNILNILHACIYVCDFKEALSKAKPQWRMNRHFINEGQECKTGHGKEKVFVDREGKWKG
jgi:hypothetical protein